MKRLLVGVVIAFLMSLLLIAPLPAIAAVDSVTVSVSPTSVVGAGTFTVSGSVTAATGDVTSSAVFIQITNPSTTNVGVGSAQVSGTGGSGTYSKTFTAGGNSNWVNGTYKVTVTYGTTTASPATSSATFAYSPTATTTTTTQSTAQTTTTTVTTTVTSTTTSVSTTTATATTTTTATTTSVSVQTSTVTSTTTSTTTTSALILSTNDVEIGGAILLVLIIALAGIVLIRRR